MHSEKIAISTNSTQLSLLYDMASRSQGSNNILIYNIPANNSLIYNMPVKSHAISALIASASTSSSYPNARELEAELVASFL